MIPKLFENIDTLPCQILDGIDDELKSILDDTSDILANFQTVFQNDKNSKQIEYPSTQNITSKKSSRQQNLIAKQNVEQIRVEYVNPFIEAVDSLFHNMLGKGISKSNVSIVSKIESGSDIVSMITLNGHVSGVVAIVFPVNTALSIVSKIYDNQVVIVDSVVFDALSELVNVIAGGAQSQFIKNQSEAIELSVPKILRGNRFSDATQNLNHWMKIAFESDFGNFAVCVTMRMHEN